MTDNNNASKDWWKRKADKPIVTMMIFLHVLALGTCLPLFFSWSGVILFAFLYWLTAWFGLTLCYHRLLTHKSFKTPSWVRWLATCCGCLAFQGSPLTWIGTHRYHHKHSDADGDPHTPKHGFSWAHIFWMLKKPPEGFDPTKYARDLAREPMMMFFHKYNWLPQVVLALLLYTIGFLVEGHRLALSWVIWGIGLRTVVVYHVTWFVNSACHTWGYKNFGKEGTDDSRNLWWVALLTGGEGWHENHHAHPGSASHGMQWWEIDPTYWTINVMSWFGMASDISRPPPIAR